MSAQVVEIAQWRARQIPNGCACCVDGWTTVRIDVSAPGRPARQRTERFPCDHCGGPTPEPPRPAA